MTLLGALPQHLAGFETQMNHPIRQISLHGTQHQRGLPIASQGNEFVKLCRFDVWRNFGIYRANPFEQMRRDPTPPHRVVTTNHHQTFRRYPAFPRRRRTQPTPDI